MRIVTLNTWGISGPYQKRWDFLLRELKIINPDLICLQEVFHPELTLLIKLKLNLKFGFASISSGLSIIAKYEINSEKIITYKTQSSTESQPRQAIICKMNIGKKEIMIANTHLSWKSEDASVRLGQVKEFIEVVNDQSILAGDFNDVPESPAIEAIRKADFIDPYELVHPKGNDITWDNQNPFIQSHKEKFPDRRIDFLFIHQALEKELQIKKCVIIFNRKNLENIYPSDHYGLLVETA